MGADQKKKLDLTASTCHIFAMTAQGSSRPIGHHRFRSQNSNNGHFVVPTPLALFACAVLLSVRRNLLVVVVSNASSVQVPLSPCLPSGSFHIMREVINLHIGQAGIQRWVPAYSRCATFTHGSRSHPYKPRLSVLLLPISIAIRPLISNLHSGNACWEVSRAANYRFIGLKNIIAIPQLPDRRRLSHLCQRHLTNPHH